MATHGVAQRPALVAVTAALHYVEHPTTLLAIDWETMRFQLMVASTFAALVDPRPTTCHGFGMVDCW